MKADDIKCEEPSERCCGAACNQPQRDSELKLIGARAFNRLLQSKLVLTPQQKHFFNVIETEYHESLIE